MAYEHLIDPDRCKGCGFCIEFCPNQVLKESPEFNRKGYHPPLVTKQGECVNCNLCEIICPEFAIYSVELDPEALKKALAGKDQQGCDCCPEK